MGRGVADAIIEAMRQCSRRWWVESLAYCIMPEHVHALVQAKSDEGDVAKWIRYVKTEATQRLRTKGLWQRSFWDRHLRDDDDLAGVVDYLLHNPVRRGLCDRWEQWPYSWSSWQAESRGPSPND